MTKRFVTLLAARIWKVFVTIKQNGNSSLEGWELASRSRCDWQSWKLLWDSQEEREFLMLIAIINFPEVHLT